MLWLMWSLFFYTTTTPAAVLCSMKCKYGPAAAGSPYSRAEISANVMNALTDASVDGAHTALA